MNKSELFPFIYKTVGKKNTIQPTDVDVTDSCILEHFDDDEKVE